MEDKIYTAFLKRQRVDGLALVRESDLVDLAPLGPVEAPDRYIVTFRCQGLVREAGQPVREGSGFQVGIWFPSDYLRHAEPFQVLTWLGPQNIWHPNIRPPYICVGRLTPGTPLVDLIYQCYDIITYQNWAPHDGLQVEACQWARNADRQRFPVDKRPLKRRAIALQCEPLNKETPK